MKSFSIFILYSEMLLSVLSIYLNLIGISNQQYLNNLNTKIIMYAVE